MKVQKKQLNIYYSNTSAHDIYITATIKTYTNNQFVHVSSNSYANLSDVDGDTRSAWVAAPTSIANDTKLCCQRPAHWLTVCVPGTAKDITYAHA